MKTALQILDEMIEEHNQYNGRSSSLISQRISALESAKERIQKENYNEAIIFADWYCNGISNRERKSPEEEYERFINLPSNE